MQYIRSVPSKTSSPDIFLALWPLSREQFLFFAPPAPAGVPQKRQTNCQAEAQHVFWVAFLGVRWSEGRIGPPSAYCQQAQGGLTGMLVGRCLGWLVGAGEAGPPRGLRWGGGAGGAEGRERESCRVNSGGAKLGKRVLADLHCGSLPLFSTQPLPSPHHHNTTSLRSIPPTFPFPALLPNTFIPARNT